MGSKPQMRCASYSPSRSFIRASPFLAGSSPNMIFPFLRFNIGVWTIDHEEAAWEPMLRPPSPVPDPFVPVRRPPSAPLPIAMLGVPFDSLTISQTVAQIEAMIESGRPHYVVTAN